MFVLLKYLTLNTLSYLPTPPLGQDMTLVASPRLKNLVCLTIYP